MLNVYSHLKTNTSLRLNIDHDFVPLPSWHEVRNREGAEAGFPMETLSEVFVEIERFHKTHQRIFSRTPSAILIGVFNDKIFYSIIYELASLRRQKTRIEEGETLWQGHTTLKTELCLAQQMETKAKQEKSSTEKIPSKCVFLSAELFSAYLLPQHTYMNTWRNMDHRSFVFPNVFN